MNLLCFLQSHAQVVSHCVPAIQLLQQRVELRLAKVLSPSVSQQDHSVCSQDVQSVACLVNGSVEVWHRKEGKEAKAFWILGDDLGRILIHLPCTRFPEKLANASALILE